MEKYSIEDMHKLFVETVEKAEDESWRKKMNKYYSKLEELYPGCLSNKQFAKYYASHLYQINRGRKSR